MPEITIALFPDVGGSWFLNRMPGQVGRFLALTSSHINATDAIYCGLGTHFLANDQKVGLLADLSEQAWSGDAAENHEVVGTVLADSVAGIEQPDAQIEPHIDRINDWMAGDDLAAIHARVMSWHGEDSWLGKARDGFAHGPPLARAGRWGVQPAALRPIRRCSRGCPV